MTTKPVVDLTDYKDPKACSDLKAVHDTCFHKWMREKFLPGTATEDECKVEWDAYQVCLEKKLAAFNLSHLLRKNGTQKPIDISVELKEDEPTL